MSVWTLGINHQTAPLDLRGRFAFALDQIQPTLHTLRSALPRQPEATLLSTCNRTELYGAGDPAVLDPTLDWLAQAGGVSSQVLRDHAYVLRDDQSARHAFRVASGLDSIFTVKSVKLEKAGERQAMRITFSQPVTGGLEGVKMDRFSYMYQEEYGSPKIDEEEVRLDKPVLSADGRELVIGLEARRESIHHLVLSSLKNKDQSLEGADLYYQVTELP